MREAIVGAEPNGISHLLLSEAYLKLGDFRGAWRAAARAADLAPEQAKVHDDRRFILYCDESNLVAYAVSLKIGPQDLQGLSKLKLDGWPDERRNISRDRHTS